MGLLALMLLQHARRGARLDDDGEAILLEDQDRSLWAAGPIAEGVALIDKATRHRAPGPYQIQAAIAALHARAARPQDTDWQEIRRPLRGPRAADALAGGDPQPRRGRGQNPRPAGRPWR